MIIRNTDDLHRNAPSQNHDNDQSNFNNNGIIDAIPIIGYHDIDNNRTITSTGVNLFDAEMKYLHDNGFKLLTMSGLGYDENSNYLYIKGR
jgi:hypothetical protein